MTVSTSDRVDPAWLASWADATPRQRRDRACEYRQAAERQRHLAERIENAVARPARHPLPRPHIAGERVPPLSVLLDPLPFLARRPIDAATRAARHHDLADALDRRAAALTASSFPAPQRTP